MYAIETIAGTRVRVGSDGLPQVDPRGNLKRAAKTFRTTDPAIVADKLRGEGLEIAALHRKSPLWSALQVRDPHSFGTSNDYYQGLCKILLAHTGRDALRIEQGALRMACANQFLAPWLSIRHTDPMIDAFMDDPARYVLECLSGSATMQRRIEALRDSPLVHDYTVLAEMSDLGPSVKHRLTHQLRQYVYEGVATLWSLAQACTWRTAAGSPLRKAGMAVVMANGGDEARLEAWRDALPLN
jgi:hypothetical protein